MIEDNLHIDALILFKDYTHLELKNYYFGITSKITATGGGDMPYEVRVVNLALDYHRYYNSRKLNKN